MNKTMACHLQRQSGAMALTVALWMITLLGFVALAFDVGHLFIVRNELQNAADAAALAGANCLTRSTAGAGCSSAPSATLNWAAAESQAFQAVGANKSDGSPLVTATIQSGYWNLNGGTQMQPQTLAPLGACKIAGGVMTTACDKPAVMVTLERAGNSNGGPVGTLVAAMYGSERSPISASSVAVISSPAKVLPGSLLPLAINKCMYDLYWDFATDSPKLATSNPGPNNIPQTIGQPWRLRIGSSYHYGACTAGQWTTFERDVNDIPNVRDLILNGNPTPLGIGDDTWIEPGTKSSAYDTMKDRYPILPADVTVAIVDYPSGWQTNTETPITGFAGFRITEINKQAKYIEGQFVRGTTSGAGGIGPSFGTFTPPRLAR